MSGRGPTEPHGTVAERNSFGTAGSLAVGDERYAVHRLAEITPAGLPITLRIVLENLLRHEDGARVTSEQVESLLVWGQPGAPSPSASSAAPTTSPRPARSRRAPPRDVTSRTAASRAAS